MVDDEQPEQNTTDTAETPNIQQTKVKKTNPTQTNTNVQIQLNNQKDFSHDLIDRSLSKIRVVNDKTPKVQQDAHEAVPAQTEQKFI